MRAARDKGETQTHPSEKKPSASSSPCSSVELRVALWEAAAPSHQAGGRDMALAINLQGGLVRLGVLDHAVGQAHVAAGACLPQLL